MGSKCAVTRVVDLKHTVINKCRFSHFLFLHLWSAHFLMKVHACLILWFVLEMFPHLTAGSCCVSLFFCSVLIVITLTTNWLSFMMLMNHEFMFIVLFLQSTLNYCWPTLWREVSSPFQFCNKSQVFRVWSQPHSLVIAKCFINLQIL